MKVIIKSLIFKVFDMTIHRIMSFIIAMSSADTNHFFLFAL